MLVSAIIAFTEAQDLKRDIEDSYYEDADRDEEQRARRIARGLTLGALIPMGVGVFTTILLRHRMVEKRRLDREITELERTRRDVVERLRAIVELDAQHAAVGLNVTF